MRRPPGRDEFSVAAYVAYVFYVPLFIAGPVVTFNDFCSQVKERSRRISLLRTLVYGVRLAACVLLLEVLLHAFHVSAIRDARAWRGFSALEFGVLGFWSLKIIWLKLLVIWRVFRLAALADGIEPPENMQRCMSNNYSGLGFWRGWHCSFNMWLVRYVYVPLGGSRRALWNVWPVFAFVAVWHDLQLRLLVWGGLVCLFLVPEVVCGRVARALRWTERGWYRQGAAVGAALNIFLLMAANLVGFAVGVEGLWVMLAAVLSPSGVVFVVTSFVVFFAAAQLMFEVRAEEQRRGIFRRC